MNTHPKLLNIIFLLLIAFSAYSQDYHVRIGFIGNSITIGSGLANPVRDCYPSQLAVMLKEKYGDTCIVTNYAVSGRTMLKQGDLPLWNEADFKRCLDYSPNICFICLGTNDSKPYNWDDYGQEFYADYKAMIDTFTWRNPETKFIVCRPAPAFAVVYDIRNPVIIDEVIPLVDSISKTTGAELVDFYHPLLDSVDLFPDKIHPNPRGAKAMAAIAFEKIVSSDIVHKIETGRTYVTSLKTNIAGELRLNDPLTITWTTIDAKEVFLNGVKVNLNGSLKDTLTETTNYILVAKGEKNSDSLILVQKVYIPELKKFTPSVSSRTIDQGDTVKIKLNCYDQKNKIITDSVFTVNWSVNKEYGRFVNNGINSVQFIGDSIGIANIECSVRGISSKIAITINKRATSSVLHKIDDQLTVFPNPFTKSVFFNIPMQKPGILKVEIFDTNGHLQISQSRQMNGSEKQYPELNTAHFSKGIYFYRLEFGGFYYSGKIIKN